MSAHSRPRPFLTSAAAGLLAACLVLATDGVAQAEPADSATSGRSGSRPAADPKAPRLATSVVMNGLDIPWDVAVLPNGALLVTERDRERITLRRPNGREKTLAATPAGFWHGGETGLMSIVADPAVRQNRRFYTCTGFRGANGLDVRVIAWRLSKNYGRATRVKTLLKGIQVTSGRHGGCRVRFDPRGEMYVGTGDAAVATNPQNRKSLNGKVLRLNRFTGAPSPRNPWAGAANRKKRYVYTYGHRNVQGLAWRGVDDRMWSVEHGSYRDDEVNRLRRGGNYGWDPGPGYDVSTPMTEHSLPGKQINARWRSGNPTIAPSGAVWVRGKKWGAYRGTLAMAVLGDQKLMFLKFNRNGKLKWTRTPAALNGDFGRLRSVVLDKKNNLLVTTANGGRNDRVIRIRPR